MANDQGMLFDRRFLERYAGTLITETPVAITELVANAWDAYATRVSITWPKRADGVKFSIEDNGKGMTAEEFERRWKTFDYDRRIEQGPRSDPPTDLGAGYPPRKPYGRNGKGRHAAFRFSDPYRVRTWRDGLEVTYEVQRGDNQPFIITKIGERDGVAGHGTEILAVETSNVALAPDDAREILGTRFLADPTFAVELDGKLVTFEDIPSQFVHQEIVEIPNLGNADLVVIDTQQPERALRQHGIAWRVTKRMVGNPSWVGFDHERILDGRTPEARRLQFLISADFLEEAVLPDWTGFDVTNESWKTTQTTVYERIKAHLSAHTADRRRETKESVRGSHDATVQRLAPRSRDRWNRFVDQVVDTCPSISTEEVKKVAGILANLELATSKYALIEKLHELKPGDMDALNQILADWTVRFAKDALDEIQSRLKLIKELDIKLRDATLDEVADLQPLIGRSLWVFGPEFESIEFTSNRGMTEVVQRLFGIDAQGSRQRPDFAILPDGSAGFYSRDSHDYESEVGGVARLVIVEIKKVGVSIGSREKEQPWRYAKELTRIGAITSGTKVTCFVLGSKIEAGESGEVMQGNGQVIIRPINYDTFIRRAEARMLGLRAKLAEVPFLKELDANDTAFLEDVVPVQQKMEI